MHHLEKYRSAVLFERTESSKRRCSWVGERGIGIKTEKCIRRGGKRANFRKALKKLKMGSSLSPGQEQASPTQNEGSNEALPGGCVKHLHIVLGDIFYTFKHLIKIGIILYSGVGSGLVRLLHFHLLGSRGTGGES